MTIYLHRLDLPCASILLGEIDGKLSMADYTHTDHHLITLRRIRRLIDVEDEIYRITPVIASAVKQINEYFNGVRREFDIPLRLIGSPFQMGVWRGISEFPYGDAVSYGELARKVGFPGATRAVASAVGSNPLPIIIPCHRVLTAAGRNSGYSGGVAVKEFLQHLENSVV